MSRKGAERMPAAGGLPRHGTCNRVERSSTMVVGVVIRRISRVVLSKNPLPNYDAAVMTSSNRLYLFDTTLRDGAQTQGVDFTVADKAAIARELDLLGIDYIEGGWPGANPTDDRFFADPPEFQNAKFVAFGMTRRAGRSAANDPGLAALLQTKARNVCMVGKTWDFHVDVALEVGRTEYLAMIADSLTYAQGRMNELMFH